MSSTATDDDILGLMFGLGLGLGFHKETSKQYLSFVSLLNIPNQN